METGNDLRGQDQYVISAELGQGVPFGTPVRPDGGDHFGYDRGISVLET